MRTQARLGYERADKKTARLAGRLAGWLAGKQSVVGRSARSLACKVKCSHASRTLNWNLVDLRKTFTSCQYCASSCRLPRAVVVEVRFSKEKTRGPFPDGGRYLYARPTSLEQPLRIKVGDEVRSPAVTAALTHEIQSCVEATSRISSVRKDIGDKNGWLYRNRMILDGLSGSVKLLRQSHSVPSDSKGWSTFRAQVPTIKLRLKSTSPSDEVLQIATTLDDKTSELSESKRKTVLRSLPCVEIWRGIRFPIICAMSRDYVRLSCYRVVGIGSWN